MRHAILAGAAAILVVPAAAPAASPAAGHAFVTLRDMAFGAPTATLTVGDVLTFSNSDSFRHTATVADQFDLDLKPGQSGDVLLKQAGTFEVICRYHPTMKLTLVVRPATASHGQRRP